MSSNHYKIKIIIEIKKTKSMINSSRRMRGTKSQSTRRAPMALYKTPPLMKQQLDIKNHANPKPMAETKVNFTFEASAFQYKPV